MTSNTILEDPTFTRIQDFQGARDSSIPTNQLKEIRSRAVSFREKLLSQSPVLFYQSFGLVRVPYPTKYGFLNACRVPTPLLHIINRMFIVQFKVQEDIKTLLISPSDVDANKETPFFKRLSQKFGPLQKIGESFVAPRLNTVENCLAKVGILPEQVDYISYDHLHTQDLRKWLGTSEQPGYFPNAKLLIMKKEWESTLGLLPPQRDWYCPDGIKDILATKVILLEEDMLLGESVALIQTPGHTWGNHSFVVHVGEDLFVTSENGIGPDSYAPLHSKIPGIRKYAKATEMEVILNGNTQEGGLDQYLSMIQEKEIAGKSSRNTDFYNMVCSSELASYYAFPGIKPTFSFGDLEFGTPGFLESK